jgi:1,4-dihydroxy-2-naphthoate octaprenyltransferase
MKSTKSNVRLHLYNVSTGKDLIPVLGRTGKLQLIFAMVFAIALAIQ